MSDSPYPEQRYWNPPLGEMECGCECGHRFPIEREKIWYWPDHLWAGAVMAYWLCPECKKENGCWSHKLPWEWADGHPRKHWLEYNLPRLIYSCHFGGIPAASLPEFEAIPHFGAGGLIHGYPRWPIPHAPKFDIPETYPLTLKSFIVSWWKKLLRGEFKP